MKNTKPDCNEQSVVIGIDIAKRHLDVATDNGHPVMRFPNDMKGIDALISWLEPYTVDGVIAEATGGLELLALIALHEAGYPVSRVNPRWIKDFARAQGKRAKTDVLDAQLIALYGRVMRPDLWQPMDEEGWTFKDLCARRRQLIGMLTMEINRSKQCLNAYLARQHQHLIITLKGQVNEIDIVLEKAIERCEDKRRKVELICSVPGVAKITANTLLAELPELGNLSAKQVASLTGLAPFSNESGKHKGIRRIFGGRGHVRKALYMVVVGMARRNNAHFKAFYKKLLENGKPSKVALVAVMRKLIVTINAMIRKNTAWQMHN